MAEFLIKAVDATHPDPIKDVSGCYKRSDIVEVFEDGRIQNPYPNSPFVLIRVSGITKKQADKYMGPVINGVTGNVIRRRKYRIRIDDIPNVIKQALKANRYVDVTFEQIKKYLRNKVTNLDEV